MPEPGSPASEGPSPREYIALSRRLLHLANQGTHRIEFLRELSVMLLGFARCNVLTIRVHGDYEYRWRAAQRPRDSFTYEHMSPDPYVQQLLGSDLGEPMLRELVMRAAAGSVEAAAAHITPYGSLWVGDVAEYPEQFLEDVGPQLDVRETTRSLAVIPFMIGAGNGGVVQLEAESAHVFGAHQMEYYEAVVETLGLAIADRRAQAALRERVKELGCLYGIARVMEGNRGPLRAALLEIVRLLPTAWQFPEIAEARIVVDDEVVDTGSFATVKARHGAEIVVGGEQRGRVEVGYVKELPQFAQGAFLREEEYLIQAVAREVGRMAERRQATEQRRKLEEQLRHADRLATVGQLAAGVAHEINEPLGSILGFAQLAGKADAVPEGARRDIEKIVSASLHAREIVNKLMLFSRQAPTRKLPVQVNQVAVETLSMLEGQCAKEGIDIKREFDEELPTIHADPIQLSQMLVNLVVNAIQAMPGGGTLTVRTRGADDGVIADVQDTGVGMESDVIKQVYDPFFTTKDVGRGTGLGLAVVHGIVTGHGGTIVCESRVGEGSRFTVRLPYPGDEPNAGEGA